MFVAGDLVDQYQVLRLLGRGGVGEVWLARDQVLGRKVALKVLRTDATSDDGRSLNDLLVEARANAAVVHPNVVTVYAVGSYRGAPYLALEYLDGSTLRERMAARRPNVPEALRFARDIAAAVAAAHDTGVLHLDLKPDNVLLASDGRLRVVDFGLARLARRDDLPAEHSGLTIAGTPAYMPPEVWRGEPPTEAADAWAFGVVLCELLTGVTPYAEQSMRKLVAALYAPTETPLPPLPGDLPADVRQLLTRLLQKDPARRPRLVDVERVLGSVLARDRGTSGDENPYRGLHPFRETDAARYFGRDDEIEAFVARLDHAPVLPIVGHSGAGKSSFVRAGVIPRLRERGSWVVVDLRPGPRPFTALARALRAARVRHATDANLFPVITPTSPALASGDVTESGSVRGPETITASAPARIESTDAVKELAATLQQAPERLYLELAELARSTNSRVLLVVDQLEEAATLVADEAVSAAFLRAIAGAADDVAEPVRVVCTLRDDYLGRLAAVPVLRAAFAQVTVLRRPDLSMLVESIIAPLVPLGVGFDDGNLPLEMARAVQHEPAALPLLSFTCSALWERRDVAQRRLQRRVYLELGGVVGALASHADAVFAGLAPEAQRAARFVLLGLVTDARTRRRRSRRELVQQCGAEAAAVVERFVEARLLTVERSARDDDSEVELAHEALVKAWARLTRLLDDDRDQVAFLADVQQAAEGWARRGRRPSELWRGAALDDALARRDALTLPMPESVRAFLDAAARERQRRRFQRNAGIGGLVALLAAVTVVLFFARARAVAAANEAIRARARAEREAAEAAYARGDHWPARAKLRTSLELDDDLATRALWRRVDADALLFSTTLTAPAAGAAFGPDGTAWVAIADDRIFAYAPRTFAARDQPALRDARVTLSAMAVLGDHLVVGQRDTGVVAALATQPTTATTTAPPLRIDAHEGGVVGIVAAPARSLFVTAGRDGRVRTFHADGTPAATLLQDGRAIAAVAVARDAASVLALDADGVLLEVPFSDAEQPVASRHPLGVGALRLATLPDDAVVVGFDDGRITVFDRARAPVSTAFVSDTGVAGLAIDETGAKLAVRDGTGALTLWSLPSGASTSLRPLAWLESGGAGRAGGLAFDATGQLLLSAAADGVVRVWRVDDDALGARSEPRAVRMSVAIADDGARVAEVGDLATVIRSSTTGEALASFPADPMQNAIALDQHGDRVVVGSGARAVVHSMDGSDSRQLPLGGQPMTDAHWLPDGALVVVTQDGTVERFDAATTAAATQHRFADALWVVAPSPDGARLAVGGGRGFAAVLDAATLAPVRTYAMDGTSGVTGAGFSADGRRVAFATATRVRVFDVDGTLLRDAPGEHIVGACTGFDDRGRVLALRAAGAVAIDVDSGAEQPLANVPPTGSCEFSRTGRLAMRLGDYVLPFDVGRDAPVWFARGVVDHVVSTQRTSSPALRWPPATDLSVLAVAAGRDHVCSAESGGAIVLRSRDGLTVRGRVVEEVPTQPLATRDGCVWRDGGGDVRRLRPASDGAAGGVVDVVGHGAAAVASDGEVVVAVGADGVRVVIDGDAVVDRALPPGGFIPEEFAVADVDDGRVAVVGPSGTLAFWTIDGGAPPTLAHVHAGDIGTIGIGPGQLVGVGYNGEAVALVDAGSDIVLVDEQLRGAPTVIDFVRRDGRDVMQVGTNLGGVATYDVGVFVADRCGALRAVWQRAPMVWDRGHLLAAPPGAEHACAR